VNQGITLPSNRRMKRSLLAVFAILLAIALVQVQAAEIHVAPAGDDAVAGTIERPVRSLTRARELIRQQPAAPGAGRTVVLHNGVWRITSPLKFGPEDSGITWRAAQPGRATISGGRELKGWKSNANGSWSLTVAGVADGSFFFRELFVNGRRAIRARTPNDDFFRVEKAGADRRTSFTFKAGEVKPVADLDQVELVFFHDWSITRVGVRSVDEAASVLTMTDNIGGSAAPFAIDNFEPHPRYFLENSALYLDAPGEWFLDRQTGVLTYRPLAGEAIETTIAVVPVATQLIDVTGEPGKPVRALRFEGIHFEHCAWQIPARGFAEGQANYHEPRTADGGILRGTVPAAIRFGLAEDCVVSGARISQLGGGGIAFGSRTRNCVMRDLVVTDVSGNGVFIGEDTSRAVDGRPWWQANPGEAASGNRVESSLIERCGRQFHGAVGIWVGFTQGSVIRNNELRDLPYTGISLGWMWNPTRTPNGNNLVEGNHIHHVMQLLSDGGGIYTLGRQPGTVLRANHIHDIPVNLGRAESNGMFIDEGSTDLVIEDNAIYNLDRSPLRFHQAGVNNVRNNLLVVKDGIPHIRCNSTAEANIRQSGNVIAKESERQP
jgi:hypothetical protein